MSNLLIRGFVFISIWVPLGLILNERIERLDTPDIMLCGFIIGTVAWNIADLFKTKKEVSGE